MSWKSNTFVMSFEELDAKVNSMHSHRQMFIADTGCPVRLIPLPLPLHGPERQTINSQPSSIRKIDASFSLAAYG